MGWVLRFPQRLDRATVQAEAERLGSNPYGFGRRVRPPRYPLGRPRWHAQRNVPPVIFAERELEDGDDLSAWIDGQLEMALDPEHGAGWQLLCAYTTAGATVVVVHAHHLFGLGRGIVGALYDPTADPADGTVGLHFDEPADDFTPRAEREAIRERLALGLYGILELFEMAWGALRDRRRSRPELPIAPLPAPRGADPTRRELSRRRTIALAFVDGPDWDAAAQRLGGTPNALLTAVAANLIRRARAARGGPAQRTLQLVVPMDLTATAAPVTRRNRAAKVSAEGVMTTASVVLPGGAPRYDDLAEVRARLKAAFIADVETARAIRGVPNIARLLPESVALRAAAHAAVAFDGCSSNPGTAPDEMCWIGPHQATDVAIYGFPIGNELIVAHLRAQGRTAIAVVTDPERMGAGADLRRWLAEELAAWGFQDVVV
jgi:hypothetical protein